MTRDAKGRYSDEEVAAIEDTFGWPATTQEDLDRMADTFTGQAVVLRVRSRKLRETCVALIRQWFRP